MLGPSTNGYPGSFPRGLITRIRRRWWGEKRAWLFAGSHKDPEGPTVDLKPKVKPDLVADCQVLPLADRSFDFVMMDPPYSQEWARKLYDVDYPSMVKVMKEAHRICEPGGHILVLHALVMQNHPYLPELRQLEIVGLVGISTLGGFSNMRALTVYKKRYELTEFI